LSEANGSVAVGDELALVFPRRRQTLYFFEEKYNPVGRVKNLRFCLIKEILTRFYREESGLNLYSLYKLGRGSGGGNRTNDGCRLTD